MFLVAEVLGHGKAGERDAGAGAWRLVHLSEDHRHLVEHARVFHFVVEVVTFAGALTDTGKHGVAVVFRCDVVDEFLDDDSLSDSRSSEEAHLSSLEHRTDEVDDLDARLEDLHLRSLLGEFRSLAVDGKRLLCRDRRLAVDRLAEDVEDAAERIGADRDRDGRAGVRHFHTAGKTVGRVHGDGADGIAAGVVGRLEYEALSVAEVDLKRVVNCGNVSAVEFDVDDRSDDCFDFSFHNKLATNLIIL